MHAKNQGHGICGSRNIYSSKVRLDNWVEETIAVEVVNNRQDPPKLYTTLMKESHCDPSLWPALPPMPAKMPTPLELKTRNKEGLAYELLFEHGDPELLKPDRFKSVTSLTIMTRADLAEKADSAAQSLLKKKSRKMLEDINQSYYKTTEQRYANAHLTFDPNGGAPTTALLKTAEIPNFKRRSLVAHGK